MKLIATIIRRLMLWSNVLLAAGLLLSFFIPYIDPDTFWIAGFAGLPFPFLWIACIFFIPVWLFCRHKYWLISAVVALITIKGILVSIGFNYWRASKPATDRSFTMMTYNCSSMALKGYKEVPEVRIRMYEELEKASPDVLCMQEFHTNTHPEMQNNFDSIRLKLHYPYHYFVKSLTHWETWHYGTVLFSRFPIIDTMQVELNGGPGTEDMITASLLIHGDTVRIISAHLVSYKLKPDDYKAVSSADYSKAQHLMHKMRRTFKLRTEQAHTMRNEIERNNQPLIVVGDFNDVPLSYTYRTVRGDLQDAFLKKGSGFGRTFSALSPSLRIDYILPDKRFSVEEFAIYRRSGFEHFPVMARLSLERKD